MQSLQKFVTENFLANAKVIPRIASVKKINFLKHFLKIPKVSVKENKQFNFVICIRYLPAKRAGAVTAMSAEP